MRALFLALLGIFSLAGCDEPEIATRPTPAALTRDAIGHYCQMIVLDHSGPKAQVHLAGQPDPLWFTQVRDAIAYDRMPEQDGKVTAIYVSDMGREGATWDTPGVDNWIAADEAYFVAESKMAGGMGAPELVPFGAQQKAEVFAGEHGGRVIRLADVSDEMVLSPVDVDLSVHDETNHGAHSTHSQGPDQ